ncbi:hypothetical protein [Streptomyces sp. H27-D2]|uniref:hypothetical protein n=1 Tax=Streptomyces sp. H27-D2 TaxID=3046304 RepID=UPI002DB85858|nr:hypothetical protein [Streptomyces sp. H27-D2]MEC4018282.1 hypothetical protein [Streptomyces sp. H27-D2]
MANNYEPSSPDYRLYGFRAADERVEDDFGSVAISDDTFVTLAEHHTGDGRDSYMLLYDGSAIWGIPGAPSYVSLHITRDLEQRTFCFDQGTHPVVPLAQNCLIRRGCPPDAIELSNDEGPRAADALTAQIEARLKTNPDNRYEVLHHYTDDPGIFDFGIETRTLTYDSHPGSASAPYRLFLEEVAKDMASYTVREGVFTSAEAADHWIFQRETPLPLAPPPVSTVNQRAEAARARSTVTAAGLAVPPAPVTAPRPSAADPSRPRRSAP